MKTAVVYFSLTGNTKRIASILAVGDTELIEGRAQIHMLSLFGLVRHPRFDPGRYDLVVVGCPVWYAKAAQPMLKALRKMDFRGKQVNVFVTYGSNQGSALADIAEEVRRSNGSPGRMVAFDMSRKVHDREVMKLLSF